MAAVAKEVAEQTAVAAASVADQADLETPKEPSAPQSAPVRPIIIKKVIEEGHGGHHGGAWKVAYADFVTAMMAFFLLLWILGATTEDQRKSIAEYFSPTLVKTSNGSGSAGVLGGRSIIEPDNMPNRAAQTGQAAIVPPSRADRNDDQSWTGQAPADKPENNGTAASTSVDEQAEEEIARRVAERESAQLEAEVRQAIASNPALSQLAEQVTFAREKDGLRIELLDKADSAMFDLGTSRVSGQAVALLSEMAKSLASIPNELAVRGHTDSLKWAGNSVDNWLLSAARANETRKILEGSGVLASRIQKIEGFADQDPINPLNSLDPRNRRISIKVLDPVTGSTSPAGR